MPKRTIALIVILILITASLLYIALSPKTQPVVDQKQTTNKPTPVPVVNTKLMLSPNPVTISSTSASVNIDVDTGDNKLTAVQLEVMYDPKLLTNVDISIPTQNSFVESPMILLKDVNKTEGKIVYAFGIPPTGNAKKGVGTIATITFTPLVKSGQATLEFSPNTKVTAEGQATSVLKEATGTTINLGPATSTSSAPLQR